MRPFHDRADRYRKLFAAFFASKQAISHFLGFPVDPHNIFAFAVRAFNPIGPPDTLKNFSGFILS
jgi:hypothetical protein